jgi:hypothetical protein
MLTSGMLAGLAFSKAPTKAHKNKVLIVSGFASITAIVLIFTALLYQASLPSIYTFNSFLAVVEKLPFAYAIGGSIPLTTAVILVGLFEVGIASGFAVAIKLSKTKGTNKNPNQPTSKLGSQKIVLGATKTVSTTDTGKTTASIVSEALSMPVRAKDSTGIAEEQGLKKDEQSIMELFLYGKVTEIVPVADLTKPGGYYLKGMPKLGWDIKRSRQVLDSLVRKGFLKAELVDKMITCKSCGSANVRVKRACPDCKSLKLSKEGLIEHFSCGAVERQDAFETENGDLVCPKCKVKLQLIGSDYRKLPPAYQCLECNTLSSEPSLITKCRDCESTADMHEEPETYLYAYTVNSGMPVKEMQQIKPIEACVNFFKSLGYTIITPALVSGKSGTQHLFDILILGRVGWVEDQKAGSASTMRKDNGNTVVQLLISSKPVDIEEITRMYGMINDVECDAISFVIPALTESARNYAIAYNMKISEGQTIEEALEKSKIPHAANSKAGN